MTFDPPMNINIDTATVTIGDAKLVTTRSVAVLIATLALKPDELIEYGEIMRKMKITRHTFNAYLREARRIIASSNAQIRTIHGQGVVLEEKAQVPA